MGIVEVCESGIYGIRHVESGRIYVGSSRWVEYRLWTHRRLLRNGFHHNRHLQFAWQKYGEESFEEILLERCDVDQLLVRERFYLTQFTDVYNVSRDPTRPSGSRRGRTYLEMYGEERTRELIAPKADVMSQTMRGRSKTPEQIEKIRSNAERSRKISEAKKRYWETLNAEQRSERNRRKRDAKSRRFVSG